MSTETNDCERWLNGEISLGKLIELSRLKPCNAQAMDFAGHMANTYNEKIKLVFEKIERLRSLADAEYKSLVIKGGASADDLAAEAALKRAYAFALIEIRKELGFAL